MFELFGMKFANTIGVLYSLKAAKKHKTLQETYKMLESSDFENMLCVLTAAYNKANGTDHTEEAFVQLLDTKGYGFLAIADIYKEFVEGIMFSGLTAEQVEARKKQMNL